MTESTWPFCADVLTWPKHDAIASFAIAYTYASMRHFLLFLSDESVRKLDSQNSQKQDVARTKKTHLEEKTHQSASSAIIVRSNDGLHDKTASTLVSRILVRIIVDCMILRESLSFEYTVYSTDIDKEETLVVRKRNNNAKNPLERIPHDGPTCRRTAALEHRLISICSPKFSR